MNKKMILPVTLFVALCAAAGAGAAEPLSEREKAMQERIEQLESQLDDANRTIRDLQGQLEPGETSAPAAPAPADSGAVVADTTPAPAAATPAPPPAAGVSKADAAMAVAAERFTRGVDSETAASVTRLRPEDLMLGGVEDAARLEYLVPGLRFGRSGQDVRFSMRGARSNSIGPQADPVVAMYEDGVHIATSTEGFDPYFDVERIDVIRGPENIAFGQRAYAGAISVVSNKPSFDGYGGFAELENGLPDKTRWRMVANLPFTDTFAMRFAGVSESRSGWIENTWIEPDSDDLNDRKVQTMRGSLLWQPNDAFSLLFISRYLDENGTGSGPWGYQQIGAYVDGELLPGHHFAGGLQTPDQGPWKVTRNFISAAQYEHWVNTLDLNWNMGWASLRWLSNFTAFHGSQFYDNDYSDLGSPTDSPFSGWKTDRQRTWSSELRLTSEGSGPLSWLAGFYYSSRETRWGWLEHVNGNPELASWDTPGEYTLDNTALFGQMSYRFGDRWTATGGLRWTKDEKTTRTGVDDDWDDVLWKAALQYDVSDRTMTWLSVSTGYRPGGINTAPGVDPFWNKEKLTAYELGVKAVSDGGRVQWNLAGWYNDFSDVQSQSFLVLPYPGSPEATEFTGNGGSLDAKGIEAEIQWTPMPQWSIATQIAWTDAEFGNYTAPNLPGLGDIPGHTEGDTLSYKDWRPALSPEWVIGLQTSYTFSMGELGTLTPYLQSTYASEYYANDINVEGVRQGSHTRTDLRLIWLSPGGNVQFQLYYLNAEDDATLDWVRMYSPAVRPEITTLQANWDNPNTYGIIFDWRF